MISQKNYFADIEGVATDDPHTGNSLIAWVDTWVDDSTATIWGFSEDGLILSLEGEAPRGEERIFTGDGSDILAIDLIVAGRGVDSIKVEDDAYEVPQFTIAASKDALETVDASVWEADVRVLVTAEWDDGAAATGRKKAPAKKKKR